MLIGQIMLLLTHWLHGNFAVKRRLKLAEPFKTTDNGNSNGDGWKYWGEKARKRQV